MAETASQRFTRDLGTIADDRRIRGLNSQKRERAAREYVEADGTTLATAQNTNP